MSTGIAESDPVQYNHGVDATLKPSLTGITVPLTPFLFGVIVRMAVCVGP